MGQRVIENDQSEVKRIASNVNVKHKDFGLILNI